MSFGRRKRPTSSSKCTADSSSCHPLLSAKMVQGAALSVKKEEVEFVSVFVCVWGGGGCVSVCM